MWLEQEVTMEVLPAIRHWIKQGLLILFIALVAACGGGSGSSSEAGSNSSSKDDDKVSASETESQLATQAMESIYNNRRTPAGFYTEPEPDPGIFQTILHIKNIDVMTPGSYNDATPR